MRKRRRHRRNTTTEVIGGVLAGALATWAMGKVTSALYAREDKRARRREDNARNGKTAYGVAAEKVARLAGIELTDQQRDRYGSGIHWALGMGTGALYGMLRQRVAPAGFARGLAFGTAFWLLIDEGANYALRLTPGPRAFPWQAHARGLAGHVVYGVVADAALRAVRAAT